MFSLVPAALIALSAASSVQGLVVPRATPPATYAVGYLEDYTQYHTRYMAIGCNLKHNTTFFDQCCHPMLATETLAKNRPKQCDPANLPAVSASAAQPAATAAPADEGDDEDCDDSDDSEEDAGDDSDDCDDSEDDGSDEVPASSHVSTSTKVSTPAITQKQDTTKAATSTKKATPTPAKTTSKAAPPAKTPPPSTGSTSSATFTDGVATFFFQNGVAGACGTVHKDTDFIAAIDEKRYGNSGRKSALCGQKVKITNPANGKSVTVTIADDCPTCKNGDSIDLSVSAFTQIATKEQGEVNIHWSFV